MSLGDEPKKLYVVGIMLNIPVAAQSRHEATIVSHDILRWLDERVVHKQSSSFQATEVKHVCKEWKNQRPFNDISGRSCTEYVEAHIRERDRHQLKLFE